MERASYRSIPGHPRWMVAPIEMAWEGRSVGEIRRQIKDPARNGGRDLKLLHEHLAHDELVAWGWQPGTRTRPRSRYASAAGRIDPGVDRYRRAVSLDSTRRSRPSTCAAPARRPVGERGDAHSYPRRRRGMSNDPAIGHDVVAFFIVPVGALEH